MASGIIFGSRLFTGILITGRSAPFLPHLHEDPEIGVVIRGVRHLTLGGVSAKIAADDVLFIPPMVSHSCEDEGNEPFTYLTLRLNPVPDDEILEKTLEKIRQSSGLVFKDPEISALILSLACTLNAKVKAILASQKDFDLEAQLKKARVRQSAPNCSQKDLDSQAFYGALLARLEKLLPKSESAESMPCELDPTLKVQELALKLGISESKLLREVHRRFALTPKQLLKSLSLEKAQKLIAEGTSLSDAAAASGFCDQAHLTREFVRTEGATPGAFRAHFIKPRP